MMQASASSPSDDTGCTSEGRLTLTLRRVADSALALETSAEATVEALVQQIAASHGYAADQVLLMKGGEALESNRRLADYPAVLDTQELYLLLKDQTPTAKAADLPSKARKKKAASAANLAEEAEQYAFQSQPISLSGFAKVGKVARARTGRNDDRQHVQRLQNSMPTDPQALQQIFQAGKEETNSWRPMGDDKTRMKMMRFKKMLMANKSDAESAGEFRKKPKEKPKAMAKTVLSTPSPTPPAQPQQTPALHVPQVTAAAFDGFDLSQVADDLCDQTIEVVRAAERRVIPLKVHSDWPILWVKAKLATIENVNGSRIHLLCKGHVLHHDKTLLEYSDLWNEEAPRIQMLVSSTSELPFVVQVNARR